ncbi:unnamed protein product [Peniophora sp. CBMAI 1063]|nr:unnamed protein product [Peniophora sp. CBMAI 1063]
MPFVRCAAYDDEGNPLNGGCRQGANCAWVHPSHQADWARAPTSNLALRKKGVSDSFRPPKAGKPRWPGSGKPAKTNFTSSSAKAASPDEESDDSYALGWGTSDKGWGSKRISEPGSASPASVGATPNAFEGFKGKGKAASPMSTASTQIVPSEPAFSPPPPPPPDDPHAVPLMSPIISHTPEKTSKFSNAGFINRSALEEREPGEVLSSPISASFADRPPPGPPKPVSLLETHTDSEKFLRQLLDAVFKTNELKAAEEDLARKKRMMYSSYYERASHATRQKLEAERQLAEHDRFMKDERLRSRLARLADLPNVDAHLAQIAPSFERANTLFMSYLQSVEAWRGALEPYGRGLWEEHKARVRKREEKLASDDRPDWVKNAPQLKGEYDRLIELEQSVNDFVSEREDREMQDGQTLMSELVRLAEEGNPRLHEAVERGKQDKIDSRVKQIVTEHKVRSAALRQEVDKLGERIGVALDKEVEREPRAGLEEYMASIRERVRQQHEQHAERIQAIKTQHAAVNGLVKQTDPVPANDLSKLVSEAEIIAKRQVDERVEFTVGQLKKSSESVMSSYETQQVRFLWESSEPIRLVEKYVDSDEGRRNQARTLLEEHARARDPKPGVAGT